MSVPFRGASAGFLTLFYCGTFWSATTLQTAKFIVPIVAQRVLKAPAKIFVPRPPRWLPVAFRIGQKEPDFTLALHTNGGLTEIERDLLNPQFPVGDPQQISGMYLSLCQDPEAAPVSFADALHRFAGKIATLHPGVGPIDHSRKEYQAQGKHFMVGEGIEPVSVAWFMYRLQIKYGFTPDPVQWKKVIATLACRPELDIQALSKR